MFCEKLLFVGIYSLKNWTTCSTFLLVLRLSLKEPEFCARLPFHITSLADEWKQSKMKNKLTHSKLHKIPTENRSRLQKIPNSLWIISENVAWIRQQTNEFSALIMFTNLFQSSLNKCIKTRLLQVIMN